MSARYPFTCDFVACALIQIVDGVEGYNSEFVVALAISSDGEGLVVVVNAVASIQ